MLMKTATKTLLVTVLSCGVVGLSACSTTKKPSHPEKPSKSAVLDHQNMHGDKKMAKNHKKPSIVIFDSQYDFATTTDKINQVLTEKGMKIFATIDHQQAGKDAGLTMQPATVIVFGTPKAGTPLMIKDPMFALQLPLKVLVTEKDGKVQVVMNRTEHLIQGSKLAWEDVENNLAKAEGLIKLVVSK